jgi:hypothetical protein
VSFFQFFLIIATKKYVVNGRERTGEIRAGWAGPGQRLKWAEVDRGCKGKTSFIVLFIQSKKSPFFISFILHSVQGNGISTV